MSDPEDDGSAAAVEMAAAMGFSSFGDARPNKKRRYNPHADQAVVAPSSGTNTTPLPLHAKGRASNPDEVSLDNDSPGPAKAEAPRPLPPGLPAKPSFTNLGGGMDRDYPGGGHDGSHPARGGGDTGSRFSGGRGGRGRGGGRLGERNAEWYVDYYDPSSNENPWAKLEAKLGLEPVDTWTLKAPRNDSPVDTKVNDGQAAEGDEGDEAGEE